MLRISRYLDLRLVTSSPVFSGLAIFGVPNKPKGSKDKWPIWKIELVRLWIIGFWSFVTFEAFVKTTSSFEQLVEVWPAVKNPLKRVIVAKLQLKVQYSVSKLYKIKSSYTPQYTRRQRGTNIICHSQFLKTNRTSTN